MHKSHRQCLRCHNSALESASLCSLCRDKDRMHKDREEEQHRKETYRIRLEQRVEALEQTVQGLLTQLAQDRRNRQGKD